MMDQMRKTADRADKDDKFYREVYQPLQLQQAARAQDANDPKHAEYMAGLAEAAIADKYKVAREAAEQKLAEWGVDPSQMRAGALDTGTRIAEASTQVAAGNQARLQDKAYADQLLAGAVQTGAAYPGNIANENAASGSFGNAAVNIPLAVTSSGNTTMGPTQGWQALGNQSLASSAQTMDAKWKSQLEKQQADQQSDSGIGSALGFGASLLTAPMTGGGSVFGSLFAEEGGRIPKRFAPCDPGRSHGWRQAHCAAAAVAIEGAIPTTSRLASTTARRSGQRWRVRHPQGRGGLARREGHAAIHPEGAQGDGLPQPSASAAGACSAARATTDPESWRRRHP
jgi:hypothetical protein